MRQASRLLDSHPENSPRKSIWEYQDQMPIYVYQIVREDGEPGEQFEIRQGIHDKALTHHPDSGEPVKRVIQPAFVAGSHSQMAIGKNLKDPKKLESMGFTKYEKTSDGYIKTAGNGPDLIKKPKN